MSETVLVVGSNPLDRQLVIQPLLKGDYQVRYAASDSGAIRIISRETPNAVLLIQEPDNGAQEICSLIRKAAPAMPLLVIGRAGTDAKVKLFQADADDYIIEPFDSAELLARVRSAIRRSKAH